MAFIKKLFSSWLVNDESISEEDLPPTDPFLIKHDNPERQKEINIGRIQKFNFTNITESDDDDDANDQITKVEIGTQFPDEPLPINTRFYLPKSDQTENPQRSHHHHHHHHNSRKWSGQSQKNQNLCSLKNL